MYIEAVSTIHIQVALDYCYDIGLQLKSIIKDFGAQPDCVNYLVSRCIIDQEVWVVSSYWTTYAAMERHFTDPSLSRLIDLLTSKAVRRVEFNSFFNKYSNKVQCLLEGREA